MRDSTMPKRTIMSFKQYLKHIENDKLSDEDAEPIETPDLDENEDD